MERYNKVKLTEIQLDFIRQNNGKISYNQMSKQLGITCYLIRIAMIENNIPYVRLQPKKFYKQINLTLTKDQEEYLLENRGKMPMVEIAKHLKIKIGKLTHNARMLNLTNEPRRITPVFDLNGYFNVEAFGKYYNY